MLDATLRQGFIYERPPPWPAIESQKKDDYFTKEYESEAQATSEFQLRDK